MVRNMWMTETTTFDDYGMIYLVKLDESGVTLVSTRTDICVRFQQIRPKGFEIESKVDVLWNLWWNKNLFHTG